MDSDSQSNISSSDDPHTSFNESGSDDSGNSTPQIDWNVLSQNLPFPVNEPSNKEKNSPRNVFFV